MQQPAGRQVAGVSVPEFSCCFVFHAIQRDERACYELSAGFLQHAMLAVLLLRGD